MTPKQYFKKHTKEEIEVMAIDAGTNYLNFEQIARWKGSVSKRLAEKLEQSSNGVMTKLEILYPENYPEETESAA